MGTRTRFLLMCIQHRGDALECIAGANVGDFGLVYQADTVTYVPRCLARSGRLPSGKMPSRDKDESRGCLYKLEVTNFKSYAGTLSIGPFKDFTCVIGPNGSGVLYFLRLLQRRLHATFSLV